MGHDESQLVPYIHTEALNLKECKELEVGKRRQVHLHRSRQGI